MHAGGGRPEGADTGIADPAGPHRWSRRRFLAAAGTTTLGVALAACGGPAQAGPGDVTRYLSRPDLEPPRVTVTGYGGRTGPGLVFISPAGPMIVDDGGNPVWVHPVHRATTNFQVQRYRGQPVLTWWEGSVTHGVGNGECVVLDTRYREVTRIRAGQGLQADLHELVLTPRGTAYLTAYRTVSADLRAVGGPASGPMLDAVVQEVDVATGAVLFAWHSADHIAVQESHQAYSSSVPYDPVHLNAVQELADGSLLLCARNTWAVYSVDRASGRIRWRLGGKQSDFALGPGVRFAWQHDARDRGGGLMSLFDDEAAPPAGPQSRGLLLHVDETARTVSLAQAYLHPGSTLLAGSQGGVQLLPDGDVFVGWGAKSFFTQFRHDGTAVLDGHIERGDSYRAFRLPWPATPDSLPAGAVRDHAGRATVYVSWNGATEVDTWRVLGGPAPGSLGPLASAPKAGFETVIPLRSRPGALAVQGLDATGTVVGVSDTVPG